jgi:RNA polymerase sigma-70 factor (ECF subfamily)
MSSADFEPVALEQEKSSEQIDLDTAISALAPGYRAVLVLHDIEGFTHEEIAQRLGITAGTSKGQLFKARRAVRARLSPSISEKT